MDRCRRHRKRARRFAAVIGSLLVLVPACGAGVNPTAGDALGAASSEGALAATPTIEPAPSAETTVPRPRCTLRTAIATWPLRRKIGQLLMAPIPENDTAAATAIVSLYQPGGVFLATGLVAADGRIPQIVAGADPVAPWVSIDEEGGRVQRLESTIGPYPSARQMGATMNEEQVRALAADMGRKLFALGVTMNLAPVTDVSDQPDDAIIGDRSFSADPQVATALVGAFAAGLRESGVVPVLKHFPGHGRSSGDSHLGAVTTPPIDQMRTSDLVPYESLLDDRPVAVMLGHLDVPGLTEPGLPSSLSPETLRLLREDYGFDGVVITDDLGAMGAVTDRFDLLDSAVATLNAGADMVLWGTPDRLGQLVDHLEQAVMTGVVPEARVDESVQRILRAKDVDPCAVTLT